MKKLYLAKTEIQTMFVSDELNIHSHAKQFLGNELANLDDKISVVEITNYKNIPKAWKGNVFCVWGSEENTTATEFLRRHESKDYQEYLRLKAKYE